MKKKERSSKQNKRSFPKNGLRIILAVIVVLAVIAWQADLFTPKLEAGEEADTRPVANEKSLVDVREAQVPVQRTFTGSVVSRIRVERTPQIGGTVEQVLVEAGDEVQEDELLMRLNPDLPAARRDEARAALQQAESALTGAERLLDRITRAVEADTLPEVRRIEAEQARDSAAAAVQQAKAALRAAETQLGYTELRSTGTGTVIESLLDRGDQAIPGRPAVLLTDSSRLEIVAYVPASLARLFSVGSEVSCRIPSLDTSLQGTIRTRQPEADPRTHTVEIKISIHAPHELVPGLFATVEIDTGTRTALMVPEQAVQQIRQLDIVTVADDDNRLTRRVVRTGQKRAGQIEILAGLHAGERVTADFTASTKTDKPPTAP